MSDDVDYQDMSPITPRITAILQRKLGSGRCEEVPAKLSASCAEGRPEGGGVGGARRFDERIGICGGACDESALRTSGTCGPDSQPRPTTEAASPCHITGHAATIMAALLFENRRRRSVASDAAIISILTHVSASVAPSSSGP